MGYGHGSIGMTLKILVGLVVLFFWSGMFYHAGMDRANTKYRRALSRAHIFERMYMDGHIQLIPSPIACEEVLR